MTFDEVLRKASNLRISYIPCVGSLGYIYSFYGSSMIVMIKRDDNNDCIKELVGSNLTTLKDYCEDNDYSSEYMIGLAKDLKKELLQLISKKESRIIPIEEWRKELD